MIKRSIYLTLIANNIMKRQSYPIVEKQFLQQHHTEEKENKIRVKRSRIEKNQQGVLKEIDRRAEENQSYSHEKVVFLKPTVISFAGIPGSGKSTIARKLNSILESRLYLEPEENEYPNDIKENFSRKKE